MRVSVSSVHPGDKILIYSRRRVMPVETKVRQVYRNGDRVQLHTTTKGVITLPQTASVDVP